jgi:protein-disulfide isomerase
MEPEKKQNDLAVPIAIVIAGALIGLGAYFSGGHAGTLPAAGTQPSVAVDASKVKTDGEPYIGNADAPVTIAYWFDYQCPFCKQNEEQSMPQIISDYVNTGKAKVIFKDFAFLGPDSQTLAQYARAVWEAAPSKFYDWHKAIFDAQGTENTGWATHDEIMKITTQALGASLAATVDNLVKTNGTEYQNEIDADKAEGASFGIQGTPAMVIGTQRVDGAVPYAQIKSAIDAAL